MDEAEILSRLLYRDALMLIVNKPAGLPVHLGSGGGEHFEQYFEHLRFGLPRAPSLAHRLDRDTSGCLILGRHRQALAKLSKLFENGKVKKTYLALVAGAPSQGEGEIDAPLAKKSPDPRRWHMEVRDDGQPARTLYRTLATSGDVSWLELSPITGRTHQLRVHCAHIGCPILGDRAYGDGVGPLQLHARSISLPLYATKPSISVSAPLPAHMCEALAARGWKIPEDEEKSAT